MKRDSKNQLSVLFTLLFTRHSGLIIKHTKKTSGVELCGVVLILLLALCLWKWGKLLLWLIENDVRTKERRKNNKSDVRPRNYF